MIKRDGVKEGVQEVAFCGFEAMSCGFRLLSGGEVRGEIWEAAMDLRAGG